MNKHLKRGGMVVLVAAVAACASTPMNYGYGGSQPVYGSAGGYPAAPPAPVYNSGGNYPPPVVDSSNGGYNNGGYNNGGYNQAASASTWGTVTRVENLGTKQDTGLGAAIGAGVGAIAGNQIGRQMNDAKTTGTVVGAIGGGLIGNAIERNQNAQNTMLRVYVRLDNGSERYWDVPASQMQPAVGQRLRVQNDQLFTN
jgi:outer membrane lipoprotein SlyB